MIKKNLFSILLIMVVSASAQVKVLENSASKFSFSWEMEQFDTISIKSDSKTTTSLSFLGENMLIGEIGEPAVPGYSMIVGVPPSGSVSATFSPENITTIRLLSPLKRVFSSINEIRHENLNFNSAWISEPIYSKFGNLKTAQFVIKPFVYDSVQNVVKVVTKGTCTINFPSYVSGGISNSRHAEFDKMMSSLVSNYNVAKRWSGKKLSKRANATFPINPDNAYVFKIGDGHAEVNEATTDENGIVKILGSDILRRFGTVGINQVVLHGSFKGELPSEVPSESTIPSGVVEIPLLRIDRNNNGWVDNEDTFLAYVTGASDWFYDTTQADFSFKLDRYDDYRHYWISIKNGTGLSMAKHVSPSGIGDTFVNFDNHVMYKRSLQEYSAEDGGTDWIWTKLTPINSSLVRDLPLSGLDSNFGGTISLKRTNANSGEIDISIANQTYKNCNSSTKYNITNWGDKRLTISLASTMDSSNSKIDYFQINYKRKLEAVGEDRYNIFSSLVPNSITHYKFTKATNELVYIFRIPSDESQISLIDTIRAIGNYTWSDTGIVQYFVCAESKLTQLPPEEQYKSMADDAFVVKNLRLSTNTVDFIIITHPEFVNEAVEFAKHKKSKFSNPKVVSLHDVYRYFSGGDSDPTAIRNFLAYVKNVWNSEGLIYVAIFGSAHYDYKNLKYTATNYFPTYYYGDKAVDDYYAYISSDQSAVNTVQLAIGRFPCSNRQQASDMVKKVIEMENPTVADFSEWRNRALFVADDDMQGNKKDQIVSSAGWGHHTSSDATCDVISALNPSIDIRKVYLYEYEWNSAFEKPGVSMAILNEINNGVGYVNFFGHGSEVQWADEHVLVPSHTGSMYNTKRYPIISAFSCSVGKFDIPDKECLSAALVTTPQRGAVSSVASSRLAYATENEAMAKTFYEQLFSLKDNSVGVALMASKLASVSTSRRLYCVLGDPSIHMVNPEKKVKLEVRNLENSLIDTIKALQQISVSVSVEDLNGVVDRGFGTADSKAYVYIGIFNPSATARRKDGGSNENIRYELPGMPVFLGKSQINNGQYVQQMLIPKNLSFGKDGARVTAYVWKDNESVSGTGCKSDVVFYGTENLTSIDDTVGPQIAVNKSITVDEDEIEATIRCQVEVEDESGIDVTGIGPDEGLVVEVDGVIGKRNMNHTFQFVEGSFRKGSADIVFDRDVFKPGTYKVAVSARDLLGNISKTFFDLNISEDELNFSDKPLYDIEQKYDYSFDRVFNVPNPMRMREGTRFYFKPDNPENKWMSDYTKVIIKIYTLSGKTIRVLKENASNGEYGIFWDGRDQAGTILGPNVYLYQITAHSPRFGKTTKSKIKKLVIIPPRQ